MIDIGDLADIMGTTQDDTFKNVLIPMIRRIIPGMIAQDIVGVQPMTGPSGLIMSMRNKYSDGNNGTGEFNEWWRDKFGGASIGTPMGELGEYFRSDNPEAKFN